MIFDDPVEEYLSQIRSLSRQYFTKSILKVNYLRLNRISARIEIEKDLFIDLYYNAESERKDYSLIRNGKRILGWDNLGGWHHHPRENPDKHIKCREPKIKSIFQRMRALMEESAE